MTHIIIFYYVICFIMGTIGTGILIVIYRKLKLKILFYYILFMLLLFFLVAANTTYLYINSFISSQLPLIDILFAVFFFICASGLVTIIPIVYYRLLNIPYPLSLRILFTFISLLPIVLIPLPFIIEKNLEKSIDMIWFLLYNIYINIFYITLFINLIVLIKNYKKVTGALIRSILKTLLITTFLFLPGLIADGYWRIFQIKLHIIPRFFNFLPAYYFTLNLFNIIYSSKALFLPAESSSQSALSLPDYFNNKYRITNREKSVILLMLDGKTYDEISRKLSINHGTVRNYISRIYQKTGTNSKLGLLNLLKQPPQNQ